MQTPLVSIICLSFNHSRFIEESVNSVINQTYKPIELIIVDDSSSDASPSIINKIKEQHPEIKILLINDNVGNCKAFNRALKLAKGTFIIDLATDDVLLPNRVEEGVNELTKAGTDYGVQFTDAEYIDESGKRLSFHSEKFPHNIIPQGDIYKDFIQRYFICPPTVMFTRVVIEHLNGYDEALSYEDFDFHIRASRKFKYLYSPSISVKRRIVKNALSVKQFKLFSKHSYSTFRVCEKIMKLNKSREEQRALNHRILYEMRLNLRLLNFRIATKYLALWLENSKMKYES